MTRTSPFQEALPTALTISIDREADLLERARRQSRPTELLVAPVELHRRNVQRRLREARLPNDTFTFDDPGGVSRRLLTAADRSTETIDRVDRLALVRSLLSGSPAALSLPPGVVARDPQSIEQIRTEVEAITNFHPERVDAWRRTASGLYDPIDIECDELLRTALDVEQALRDRTETATSEAALVRRATRSLLASDGDDWRAAYPEIERVSLLGLSSLSATDADVVAALLATTSVDVDIHCRRGTGDSLAHGLVGLLDVDDPGTEVFE
jgi:hypothetical protein